MFSSSNYMYAQKKMTNEWFLYEEGFRKKACDKKFTDEQVDACLYYAKNLYIKNLPIIYDGIHLSRLVGYDPEYIFSASNSKKHFYKKYSIPKKGGGYREISEPLPSLKEIQRWILDNILKKVPIHAAAKAYIEGKSIIDNARFHKGQTAILKMDVKDFFPSIRTKHVNTIFNRMGYNKEVSKLLTELVTYKHCLPQGAPTSPTLSNIVMFQADKRMLGYTVSKKLRYTRYADDLTISGDFIAGEVISFTEMVIASMGFKVNRKKTRVVKNTSKQLVTGIVVNEKLQVDRKIRKKLRQELYYIQKFGLDGHLSKQEEVRVNYIPHILGVANHVLNINPNDKDALKVKKHFINRDTN